MIMLQLCQCFHVISIFMLLFVANRMIEVGSVRNCHNEQLIIFFRICQYDYD